MSKEKQNKNKNVTSIAIKLNAINIKNLFFRFLIIDICLILVLLGIWCIRSEKSFYGEIARGAHRSVKVVSMNSAKYIVKCEGKKTLIKDASAIINEIRKVIMIIGCLELLYLLHDIIFGTFKVRKVLRPLNEIAETANILSNMDFDEEKFQNLEEAISNISPTASNEKLSMGDSELQGLEDAINKLLDRMRDSYRQQARFVSDASHELRTPISVIQGYANMLDRWGKDDKSVLDESIEAIKTESENMKNLVEQLLFLARGINGKTQLKRTDFCLNDMINEVFEESKMIDSNHLYTYDNSERIMVNADIALLKQTARILVENAVKYTKEGECIILKTGVNINGEPYFAVEDSGIGMSEHDVPHIFERFFRADTARVRKGGTGLGLSIAKWIIDNHKGYFSVLSREGIGTRISVFLPSYSK